MDAKRVRYLLEQQSHGKSTPAEQAELAAIIQDDQHADMVKALIAELMQQEKSEQPANYSDYSRIANDIVKLDRSTRQQKAAVTTGVFRLYRWAAAVIVLVLTGTFTYLIVRNLSPGLSGGIENLPALSTSTHHLNSLSFPDGSVLALDKLENGIIASEGKVTIRKKDNQIIYSAGPSLERPVYHVLSVAENSDYQLVLSDGSRIWLNAATSVRFPSVFPLGKRIVEMSGEAWFDVRHADSLPFLVYSGRVTTTVLGTAFDIKAYPDQEGVNVAVQRGKVKVESGTTSLAMLEKGQQVQISDNSIAAVQSLDTLSVGSWRQGNLNYENELLKNVTADLQRTFKDSIVVKGETLRSLRITAHYRKKEGLRQILTMLSKLSDSRLSESNGVFVIE